ncbi:MAG: hypothetical protein IKW00_07330 [Clostridia bacterium]|nr:hypothetical protein [Clostridia bacterium]
MKLSKCPRCELNYILDGETYCKICRLEMKGEPIREEIEMCTVCGEHPAMPGKDICLFCHKEMSNEDQDDRDNDGLRNASEASIGIDPISTMDEIIPDTDDDGEMSLEVLGEEEAEDDQDEEDDN